MVAAVPTSCGSPQRLETFVPSACGSPQRPETFVPDACGSPQRLETFVPSVCGSPQTIVAALPRRCGSPQRPETFVVDVCGSPQTIVTAVPGHRGGPSELETLVTTRHGRQRCGGTLGPGLHAGALRARSPGLNPGAGRWAAAPFALARRRRLWPRPRPGLRGGARRGRLAAGESPLGAGFLQYRHRAGSDRLRRCDGHALTGAALAWWWHYSACLP